MVIKAMLNLIVLAAEVNVSWYLLPLAVVISLVYSASRYELPEKVLRRAMRLFLTIMFFMGVVFCVLVALSYHL